MQKRPQERAARIVQQTFSCGGSARTKRSLTGSERGATLARGGRSAKAPPSQLGRLPCSGVYRGQIATASQPSPPLGTPPDPRSPSSDSRPPPHNVELHSLTRARGKTEGTQPQRGVCGARPGPGAVLTLGIR